MDLYRLEAPVELLELGVEDCWDEHVAIIEWPERADALIPGDRLMITFNIHADKRSMVFSGADPWGARLKQAGIA